MSTWAQKNLVHLQKKTPLYIIRKIQKPILEIRIFNTLTECCTINLNLILKGSSSNAKQHLRRIYNIKCQHIKVPLIKELNKCFLWWILVAPYTRVAENLLWIKNCKVTSLPQCKQLCLNSNFLERPHKDQYRKPLFLISQWLIHNTIHCFKRKNDYDNKYETLLIVFWISYYRASFLSIYAPLPTLKWISISDPFTTILQLNLSRHR